MLQLDKYRITKSDTRNYRIEEYRFVESKDSETGVIKVTEKWVTLPDYYNNVEHAIKVLLSDVMVGNLLDSEVQGLRELLTLVNNTFNKLKLEIK